MNRMLVGWVALMFAMAAAISPSAAQQTAEPAAVVAEDPGWPREFTGDGARLVLYQPQLDEWANYQTLTARAAFKFAASPEEAPIIGSLLLQARTRADKERRSVYVHSLQIEQIRFPSVKDASTETMEATVRELIPRGPVTISLERVTSGLARTQTLARGVAVSLDPPPIFVSTVPAILIIIDGDPVGIDIEGTGLQYIVNTNWDLFQQPGSSRYYLLNDDMWLTAESLDSTWSATSELPDGFAKLPDDENWAEVKKHLPARSEDANSVPQVFTSREPAELVVIDGPASLQLIEGTSLGEVSNTESDFFFNTADNHFYFLTSGRWFRSISLDGPWEAASASLPEDFAKIPEDHPSGHVLSSVRGTPQAEEAVLLASVPQTATLNRAEAKAETQYVGDPEFAPIDGTAMQYAANTQSDVIRIDGRYYLCTEGVWFTSPNPEGPWEITDSVPKEMYTIPPESPKHHVTYVEVQESTPTTVTVGYTSGYGGMYIGFGTVMWGTGYYYPPYWGVGYGYPAYWRPPYYSYGAGSWYNPHTGTYGRGASAHGPWGGYGYGSTYNPRTGNYRRGGYAYDYWNDSYAAGYRGGNQYARWGEAIVGEGDDWVHGGYYRDERGTVAAGRGSEGGKAIAVRGEDRQGFVARDEDENVYVGRDGDVYKRDDDGNWFSRDGDDWDKIDQDQVDQARQDLQTRGEEKRQGVGDAGEQGRAARERSSVEGGDRALAPEQRAELQQRAGGSEAVQQRRTERKAGGADGGGLKLENVNRDRPTTAAGGPGKRRPQTQAGTASAGAREGLSSLGMGSGGSVRNMPSSDVLRSLERDSQARSRGNERTRQRRDYQRSSAGRSSGYSGSRSGGSMRRGGGYRRRR